MNTKKCKKSLFMEEIGSTQLMCSSFFVSPGNFLRVCGAQLAGFYLLSYATAQLLLQVGRCGVRTYRAAGSGAQIYFEHKVSLHYHLCTDDAVWNYSSFSFARIYYHQHLLL